MITLRTPDLRKVVVATLLLHAAAAPLHAQRPAGSDLWLPFDHWWRHAAVRLHALGFAPAADPIALPVWIGVPASADGAASVDPAEPTDASTDASTDVAVAADAAAAAARRLAAAYGARLARERGADTTAGRGGATGAAGSGQLPPASVDQVSMVPPGWHVEVAPLMTVRRGAVRAGRFTPDREWTGVEAEPDRAAVGARAHAFLRAAPWLAVSVAAAGAAADWSVEQAVAEVAGGPVAVWAGRRSLGYAPSAGGGLVLRRVDRLDGAGVAVRAWELPWLGTVSAHLFASRTAASGHVPRPWLLGTRAHARPHARFDVGATRVALFGGMGGARLGPRQLAEVLVGANLSGDFADDQVASLDARWRPPLALPIELFGEWAMHDIDPGVLFDMPAFTLGVRAPLLPGTRLGATLEHTRIAGSCCGNPPWYHHFELADSWTQRGRPLGHELGGHGREWRVALSGSALSWQIVHELHAFVRTRGAENLYAPQRAGTATGGELRADLAVLPRVSAELALAAERGRGWSELHASLAARWRP